MKIIIILIIFILIKVTFSPFSSIPGYTLQTPGYGPEVYPFPTTSVLNPSEKLIILNKTQKEAFLNFMESDPNIAIFMSDNSIINSVGMSYNQSINLSSSNSSSNSSSTRLSKDTLSILEILSNLYCSNYNEASSSLINCDKNSLESKLEIDYHVYHKFDYDTYSAIWIALTNRYHTITNNYG